VLRWLRRWRERDDQHLVKSPDPPVVIDPLEELIRLVNEAQERDAEDEHRLYHSSAAIGPGLFKGDGLNAGSGPCIRLS
jgi:hypothetical protein